MEKRNVDLIYFCVLAIQAISATQQGNYLSGAVIIEEVFLFFTLLIIDWE